MGRGFAAAQASRHFDLDMTVFYCIHIQEITGRCASSRSRRTAVAHLLFLNPRFWVLRSQAAQ